jgi:hypothetical protein
LEKAITKKLKEGKPAAAAVDQSHLKAKATIAYFAAEMENDQRMTVRKLAEAHGMMPETVHATLLRGSELLPGGCPNCWTSR